MVDFETMKLLETMKELEAKLTVLPAVGLRDYDGEIDTESVLLYDNRKLMVNTTVPFYKIVDAYDPDERKILSYYDDRFENVSIRYEQHPDGHGEISVSIDNGKSVNSFERKEVGFVICKGKITAMFLPKACWDNMLES